MVRMGGGMADGRRHGRRHGAAWAAAMGGDGRRSWRPDTGASLSLALASTATELAIRDKNPKSKLILKKLEEPISMSFNEETPLEDVLKYIKQATTTKTYAGIPIYVDPSGLKEADKTMTSTVSNMDLEGHPAQDDASAHAQAVRSGLLRARRRAHHQLAAGHLR